MNARQATIFTCAGAWRPPRDDADLEVLRRVGAGHKQRAAAVGLAGITDGRPDVCKVE